MQLDTHLILSAGAECRLLLIAAAAFHNFSCPLALRPHLHFAAAAAGAVRLSGVPPELWCEQAPG